MTVSQKIKHYLWIFIEYFSLIFFSFVALLPVVSCVITAFKTETEYQNTNVMTLPESWLNFDNFIQAFNKANMGRAFINEPAFILADEPTGNLDSKTSREILDILKFTNQKYKQTILLVTHDEKIALQANRIITIGDGKIIKDEVMK